VRMVVCVTRKCERFRRKTRCVFECVKGIKVCHTQHPHTIKPNTLLSLSTNPPIHPLALIGRLAQQRRLGGGVKGVWGGMGWGEGEKGERASRVRSWHLITIPGSARHWMLLTTRGGLQIGLDTVYVYFFAFWPSDCSKRQKSTEILFPVKLGSPGWVHVCVCVCVCVCWGEGDCLQCFTLNHMPSCPSPLPLSPVT